jgi:hypothetical protein
MPVIVLELYEDANNKHWVRFLYNGEERVVKAPASAAGAITDGKRATGEGKQEEEEQEEGRGVLRMLSHRWEVALRKGESGERREALVLAPYAAWRELAATVTPDDYDRECSTVDAKETSAPL